MQCIMLPRITEINPHLLCVLCGGYYIDATSIIECLHAFCKSCIVRYLETHKYCPICDVLVHKTEPLQNIRPDVIRQSIVYKLVPNLYKKEMRNRRNFYVQMNPQLHPACSESKGEITESSNFFSLDDLINLSLEYVNSIDDTKIFFVAKGSKRYFRCRAAVTIKSLRKLLAAKYTLNVEHKIHLFLNGNQLPDHFKLLDVAYISSWKRVGYIRILYEILTVDYNQTNVEKVDLSSKVEPIKSESISEDMEKKNVECALVDGNAEKPENFDSVSKAEPVMAEISESCQCDPSITVDATSPAGNVTNINTSSPTQEIIVISSDSELSSSAISPSKTVPATANEEVIPLSLGAVVSISLNNEVDSKPSENSDLSKSSGISDVSPKEPCPDETSSLEKPAAEINSNTTIDDVTMVSLPVPSSAPPVKDERINGKSAQKTSAKDVPNSKSHYKKERRNDRSESLPPVPALRMIKHAPKSSNAKPLTTIGSARTELKVSIPRITKSQSTPTRFAGHSPSRVSNPRCAVSAPAPTATDLISLYSKLPVRNSAVSSVKKSSAGGGSVSILRIDPKTLSPIEPSSSAAPPANTPTAAPTSGSSSSRKMLPCRPIISSAFANPGIYSCAGTPSIHLTSSLPFGKLSPAAQLYPQFPPIERSSLHPMNELVRRMFPSFHFGAVDPTKTPLDPSLCGLPPYPQSLPTAMSNFLVTKPALVKPAKYEKNRRKQPSPAAAHVALSLNGGGGDKAAFKASGNLGGGNRCGKRTSAAVTNGQIKGTVKRKNSELSDFSINNLIPIGDVKRPPPVHSCTADGINQICDQVPPAVPVSRGNESHKSGRV